MAIRKTDGPLAWQSKVVLLLVAPLTVASVILQAHWWWTQVPVVAYETLGISAVFGLVVWKLKAATPGAAALGTAITADLIFATTRFPYEWSWLHGGLWPLLTVFLLAFVSTKIGKAQKDRIGTGESKRGRNAAQIAANLGFAAIAAQAASLLFVDGNSRFENYLPIILAASALAEAAADTVSSEIGQVWGGHPRLVTTLRRVEPGTDGGITLAGTLAGILAAVLVGLSVSFAYDGFWLMIWLIVPGAIIGFLIDSFLGATLERMGWLNNDAVNFLSTVSASVATIMLTGLLFQSFDTLFK